MRKLSLYIVIITAFVACKSINNDNSNNTNTPNATTYAETITQDDLKTLLYTYASDEFEGRETGAPGQKKAVEFIKNNYKKMGVDAAKSDGNYFQNVALELEETPNINFKINNDSFTFKDDFVSASSSATNTINGEEIIFAGYGIDDKNYSDYKNIDVKNKIVVIKAGEPKTNDGIYSISGTNEVSKWSNNRQELASKRDAAKAKGAKALLLYMPNNYFVAANRYGNSNGRMTLSDSSNDMYFFIINDAVAKSLKLNELEFGKTIPANIAIDYKNNSTPIASENVAAFIKGSEKPNEIIVLSAHLDHEGIKNGEIYNGADDDGSGTVAVLEIAEAFAKAKKDGNGPKRSILFLNVTGEEKGLLGSRYYTDKDPIKPLKNTIANLNIDMIGRTDPKRKTGDRNYIYLIGSDKLSQELHDVSEAMNTKYMNIELDYTFNDDNDPNRFYYRSDHYNFAKNNIPVIFYFNGTHDDYHKPSDTVEKIEFDLLENRTRLIFYTAWELANMENTITVDKP